VNARCLALFVSLVAARSVLGADIASEPTLTLAGAKRAAAAALAYAHAHGAPGATVAVVDAGGHTIYLERLDGTFAAGADISIGKARTAVVFKRPTRGLEEAINKGRTAMVPVAGVTWFTPLQGGIPIVVGTQVVGGIGVSGAASAQQDEELAIAGAEAMQNAAVTRAAPAESSELPGVTHVPATQVARAFGEGTTGGTLVTAAHYRVAASRRDGAGEGEVHLTDTDIFYVLEGSATVITGGALVGSHEISPGELRGARIEGGTAHRVSKGDVLTIPRGIPHWFKSVDTPFHYYVIKAVDHDG
jgi:glc operon protein GlcG